MESEYALIVRVQEKSDNGVGEMQNILGAYSPKDYYGILLRGDSCNIGNECDRGKWRIFSIDGQQDTLHGPSSFVFTAKVVFVGSKEYGLADKNAYRDDLRQLCEDGIVLDEIAIDTVAYNYPNGFAFKLQL